MYSTAVMGHTLRLQEYERNGKNSMPNLQHDGCSSYANQTLRQKNAVRYYDISNIAAVMDGKIAKEVKKYITIIQKNKNNKEEKVLYYLC